MAPFKISVNTKPSRKTNFLMTKSRSAKTVAKMIEEDQRFSHDCSTYFREMVETWAVAMRNAVEPRDQAWQAREDRFEEVKAKYGSETMTIFSNVLAEVLLLSNEEMGDHIGDIYGQLAIGRKALGQVFTPYHISRLMSAISFSKESVDAEISAKGFIQLEEPACGAGALIIAFAEQMKINGYDYTKHLRVTARDIDRHCANMCYVQMRMYGIPAAVIHGDTIRMTTYEIMLTPHLVMQEQSHLSAAAAK